MRSRKTPIMNDTENTSESEIKLIQAEWKRTYQGLKRGVMLGYFASLIVFSGSAWATVRSLRDVIQAGNDNLPMMFVRAGCLLLFWGVIALVSGICFVRNGDPFWHIASALTKIQKSDDVRLIGCALEADEVLGGKDETHTVYLSHVLLRLTPDDAPMMKPYLPRLIPYTALNFGDQSWRNSRRQRLAVVALVALKAVGDSSVIPAVEKAAARGFRTPEEQRFVKFAQDCLEHLRECAANAQVAQTLLRPASDDGAHAETLLRPAQNAAADSRPQELLRVPDDASQG